MQQDVVGHWIHSREEDVADTRTYRPSDWSLPLSRLPRHTLEFRSDFLVVSRVGGPADSYLAREGRWHSESGEPMLLQIVWKDSSQPTTLEVISCLKDLLQLKVLSGSIDEGNLPRQ